MSNLGKMLAIAGMMSAIGESNFDKGRKTFLPIKSEPDWMRKKCKTCIKCGDNCNPYSYKGRIITRYSKPNYKACKNYSKNNNK